MLRRLLPSRLRPSRDVPDRVPQGRRIYAIGDVHGRLDLLERLLAKIDVDDRQRPDAQTMLIFLGDLIDRGPDSAAVVEALRQLAAVTDQVRFLMGNHEEIFLHSLAGEHRALRGFCRMGGRETALSYGLSVDDYERLDYDGFAQALVGLVPAEHRDFIQGFEDMIVLGDYAFVHAGVDPAKPLDAQRPADLRWIREPFLGHAARLAKRIVHGHTVSDQVAWRPHRIGIDTGAYASGTLTALGLEDDAQWLVAT